MKEEVYHFLKITKYLMILTGQWDFKSQKGVFKGLYKRFRYAPVAYWTLLFQLFLVSIVMNWNCKVILKENVFNYLHVSINTIVTILLNSKATKKVLASMYRYENFVLGKEREEIYRIYSGYVKGNEKIVKFNLFLIAVAAVFWVAACLRAEFTPTEHCHLTSGLAFQLWYPFDIHNHKWVGTFVDACLMIGGITVYVYSKTMPIAMMLYVEAKLKIIQRYIESLDSDVGKSRARGEAYRRKRIRFVLKKHQEVISIMESVQRANKLIVMILFYGSILDMPSYIIQMLFGEKYLLPKNCGVLFFSLISVYIFCHVAHSIIVQSTNISDVIYEKTEWISYDEGDKASLALMMLRSQRPLRLEAVTIGVVSLETFLKILKLCYTITTYFTTVYN